VTNRDDTDRSEVGRDVEGGPDPVDVLRSGKACGQTLVDRRKEQILDRTADVHPPVRDRPFHPLVARLVLIRLVVAIAIDLL